MGKAGLKELLSNCQTKVASGVNSFEILLSLGGKGRNITG